MQYSEGTIGRIFALKLETGERLPDAVVDFSVEHAIRNAVVMFVGGAGATSRLVVGPEENRGDDIIPLTHVLGGIQEVVAVGTLFADEEFQSLCLQADRRNRAPCRQKSGGRKLATWT